MTKLTKSYAIALVQNHPRAVYITTKLRETKRDLEEIGIDIKDETLQNMAQDAWGTYAEFMNAVLVDRTESV